MAIQIISIKEKKGSYEGRDYHNFNIFGLNPDSDNQQLIAGGEVKDFKIKASDFEAAFKRNVDTLKSSRLMVSETYGSDLGSYVCEHQGDFLDFMIGSIMPVFNGLEDFVNALYDTDLSNYGLDDDGNPQIPADDFIKDYEESNDIINPTITDTAFHRYSWRDMTKGVSNGSLGSRWATNVGSYDKPIYVQMYMYRNGNFYS